LKKETAQRHTLKITAFLFAISLWYYVLNSEAVEIEKKLPINFILPKGMLVLTPIHSEVTIKLKGSKAFVKNIFLNKEKLNIDLTAYYRPGTNQADKAFKVKIYPSDIAVPFGVSILDISPKELAIELDHKGLKEIPIKLQYIGALSNKRKIKELRVYPEKLMVSGPMEILRNLTVIETIPLNLALLNKDEGGVGLQIVEIDSRLKIEESVSMKVKYKTQQTMLNNIKKSE
jgi:YbbR domain-containing protein